MKELSLFDLFSFTSCGYQSGLVFLRFNGLHSEFPRVLIVFPGEALYGFLWK